MIKGKEDLPAYLPEELPAGWAARSTVSWSERPGGCNAVTSGAQNDWVFGWARLASAEQGGHDQSDNDPVAGSKLGGRCPLSADGLEFYEGLPATDCSHPGIRTRLQARLVPLMLAATAPAPGPPVPLPQM
jgi:hypothetical protein